MSGSTHHPTRARSGMNDGHTLEKKLLSSEGTTWWRSIFPTVWSVGVGIGMMGIWMEWWGRPAELGLKIAGITVWAVTSVLIAFFGRGLHDVWLAEDRLIVSGKDGTREIPLEDITGFWESRGQQIKQIKIKLRPGSPVGSGVRFVAPLKLQTPFGDHPVVQEIKEQRKRLAGTSRSMLSDRS